MANTDLFAVIGKPVAHSRSPQLMNRLMTIYQKDGIYTRMAAESALQALQLMEELDIKGINVTAPFKLDMVPLVQCEESAIKAGAVNTVIRRGNDFEGHNTDLIGLMDMLAECKGPALILGSGGAARAVAAALDALGIAFTLCARNEATRTVLAREFHGEHAPLTDISPLLSTHPLLVNTLPAEAVTHLALSLDSSHTFIDAGYVSPDLAQIVSSLGAKYFGGEEWLKAQAAPAFQLFTGSTVDRQDIVIPDNHMEKQSIALVGFMGSGKSVIGTGLANALGVTHRDLDAEIERESGKTIWQIFQDHGEEYFRELETLTMEGILDDCPAVISTGGGFPLREVNTGLLQKKCWTIWLFSNMQETLPRLGSTPRPLAHDKTHGQLSELFLSRKNHYAKCADLLIWNQGRTEDVVERLAYEARTCPSFGVSS